MKDEFLQGASEFTVKFVCVQEKNFPETLKLMLHVVIL